MSVCHQILVIITDIPQEQLLWRISENITMTELGNLNPAMVGAFGTELTHVNYIFWLAEYLARLALSESEEVISRLIAIAR